MLFFHLYISDFDRLGELWRLTFAGMLNVPAIKLIVGKGTEREVRTAMGILRFCNFCQSKFLEEVGERLFLDVIFLDNCRWKISRGDSSCFGAADVEVRRK